MRDLKVRPIMARSRIRQGFTLIELLLVMVIIAVLAAIVVPRLTGRREQANRTAAIDQISNFKTSLNTYEQDTGKFPATSAGADYQPRRRRLEGSVFADRYLAQGPLEPRLRLQRPRHQWQGL